MAIQNGQATLTTTGSMLAFGCTANYCYTMSGGIRLRGCSSYIKYNCEVVPFSEGSIVYDCDVAAKKGRLEQVVIKKICLINNASTGYRNVPTYIDTFNWTWYEYELCTLAQAKELALEYNNKQLEMLQEYLESICG